MMAKDGQSAADDSLTGKQRTKQTPVNKVDIFFSLANRNTLVQID